MMKKAHRLGVILTGAALSFAAASASARFVDERYLTPAQPPNVPMAPEVLSPAAPEQIDRSAVRAALDSIVITGIEGDLATVRWAREVPGLPPMMKVRSGVPFTLLGATVTPIVRDGAVNLLTSEQPLPKAVVTADVHASQVAAPAPAPAPVAAAPKEQWSFASGGYLRATLDEWSRRAGWQFVWGMDEQDDFQFRVGNQFSGDFRGAIYWLFGSFPDEAKVRAELNFDNTPPTLTVTRDEGVR